MNNNEIRLLFSRLLTCFPLKVFFGEFVLMRFGGLSMEGVVIVQTEAN